ncbi:MAG: hypothetical protein JNK05_28435 [Myxococcales bacterium]|nr:hypothetical protein [Myxococcales bacterium]
MNQRDIDRLLDEVRAEYRAADAREEADRRAREEQAKRAANEQRASEERALREVAKAYLRDLDPKSATGQWFASFATHYATREDAALEVVRAERELDRGL